MTDEMNEPPIAVVIGQGPMPVRCAEILKRAGFTIALVHSPDEPLQQWALDNQVPHEPWPEFKTRASAMDDHYLFSVTNFRILPPAVYERPLLGINYHDAPLPRYAGSHAVRWALHNGEREHGITWHVVTNEVDAGDILKQRLFAIDPKDNEHTLHQKCYLSGMRAFKELVAELKAGTWTRTPQDLSLRTYYAAAQVPPLGVRER